MESMIRRLIVTTSLILLSTCSVVNSEPWVTDTTWSRYNHIRLAAWCYGSGLSGGLARMPFVGKHFDLMVNITDDGARDSILKYNDNLLEGHSAKFIRYQTLANVKTSDEIHIDSFCTNRGLDDSLAYLWVSGDSVVLKGQGYTCNSQVTRSYQGEKLQVCVWSSNRYATDFRHSVAPAYIRWKALQITDHNFTGDDIIYDGIMEDEAHYYRGIEHGMFPFARGGESEYYSSWVEGTDWTDIHGWEGVSSYWDIRNSVIQLMNDTSDGSGWMMDLMDTLYAEDKGLFQNATTSCRWLGCSTSDCYDDFPYRVKYCGAGLVLYEGALHAKVPTYETAAWRYMDSVTAWDTGYVMIWMNSWSSDTTGIGLDGMIMQRLTYYYMAASPTRCFFSLSSPSAQNIHTSDTNFMWCDAIAYDIGTPDSGRWVDTSGTDGAGQSFDLYRRNYTIGDGTDVIMLYRKNIGSNYSSTSQVEYDLGGDYQLLNADSSLGSITQTAYVKNCEGQIYIGTGPSGNNRLPILNSIGSKTAVEGELLNISVSASDAEGGIPVLTASNLPTNASFVDNGNGTGQFNYVPAYGTADTYQVTFYATDDSSAVDSEVVPITVVDETPPAGVDSLGGMGALPGVNHGEIILTWTATGDDGISGTADSYEIRYSQNPIDEFSWAQDSLAQNVPSPASPGSDQSDTLQGLRQGEFYYVAIKAFDEAGNSSVIASFSDTLAAGIRSPPALATQVDDIILTATLSCSTVVSYYDPIAYEFALMDSSLAVTDILSTSNTANSQASVTFAGLDETAIYYWQCRAVAPGLDSSDWSPSVPKKFRLINVPPEPPTIAFPQDFDTVSASPGQYLVLTVTNGRDNDGPSALTYHFELYDSSRITLLTSANNVTEGNSATDWEIPISLYTDASYAWHVRCFDGMEYSPWTPWAQFTVIELSSSVLPGFTQVTAFPSPVYFHEGQSATFRLPEYPVNLIIMTVSGRVVLAKTGISGDWQWSGRNASGHLVSPGLYLWFVREIGQSGKLMVK